MTEKSVICGPVKQKKPEMESKQQKKAGRLPEGFPTELSEKVGHPPAPPGARSENLLPIRPAPVMTSIQNRTPPTSACRSSINRPSFPAQKSIKNIINTDTIHTKTCYDRLFTQGRPREKCSPESADEESSRDAEMMEKMGLERILLLSYIWLSVLIREPS